MIPFTFRLQLSILCMTNLSERNWLQRWQPHHRLTQGIFLVQFEAARETNFPFLSCVQLLKMTSKSLFVHHTISSLFCIQLKILLSHRALLHRFTFAFAFASHIIYAVITISSSLMPSSAIVQLWYMVKWTVNSSAIFVVCFGARGGAKQQKTLSFHSLSRIKWLDCYNL